jgi:dolichyl-phosphate beta-glucosyltransferase
MKEFSEIVNNIDISIIIPVYNGSYLLEKHLTPFLGYLRVKPYRIEIIVVDDGSIDSDLTKQYTQKHGLYFVGIAVNKGKGNALRNGFNVARGAIQLFTDADIPFQYANFDTFIELLNDDPDQFIIGDRTHSSSVYFDGNNIIRNLGSSIISLIINRLFVRGIKDTQCGLKGMGQTISKKLFSLSFINRFAIDIELIYLARKLNIPILKCPVQVRYNDKSTINIVRDGLKLLYDICRIRRVHGNKKEDTRTGDKVSIDGNYQYNAYHYGWVVQKYWHRFKLFSAIKNLNIDRSQQILDVGCGSGMLCSIIANDNPSVQITGIDGNPLAIAFCKNQWKRLLNAHFEDRKVDELNTFLNYSADRIAFIEVIEHITKKQSDHVLGEFYRILKKGGILVISTPNRKSLWPLLEHILDFLNLIPKLKGDQHEMLYSGKELEKLAIEHGFALKRKQTINCIAPWLAVISPRIARKAHVWESEKPWIPGSLLLYTFIKNND